MRFPSREIVERVRREYRAGTRVELVRMEDVQAPPIGTRGTVTGVDDIASILIEPDNKTAQYVTGDRGSGEVWISEKLAFTGELNRSCAADLIMGMHADSYWYAGGFDDWFLDCDS